MHESVRRWTGEMAARYDARFWPVIEIGSLYVNGDVREFFDGPFWGMDLRPGRGVDFVGDASLDIPAPFYPRLVLCLEVLEHVKEPGRLLNNVYRLLPDRGYLWLSCRGFDERGCWPLHREPVDYWRFSEEGMEQVLGHAGFNEMDITPDPEGPGWLAVARK